MNFLVTQIKEQKILEMEVSVDDFIKENNISENAIIHTLTFDKEVFVDEKEVREYLKDKWFHHPSITETDKSFIAVMVAQSQIDLETEVEVELRRGVMAQAGDLLPVMVCEDICFNEKGEVNLSSKFGEINLSDGMPHIIEVARVCEGEHALHGKIKITAEDLESFEFNFASKVTGVDLAVNEDHKKNEAFGWFKDVWRSFDKQILYAQINWNTKGTRALSEKDYRYFSPELRFNYTHPHTGMEHGPTLLGGALTNYPFLKMEAITQLNSKQQKEGNKVDTIDLKDHNAKVVELNTKINATQVDLNVKSAENITLSEEVKTLKATINLNAKKAAHDKLFNAGKISKAQLDALNEGKGLLEVISLNEKMNTKAKGADTEGGTDINLNDSEKGVANLFGLSDEEFKAVDFN